MIQSMGNDSKQWQRFKAVGLSDLKAMRSGGITLFLVLI
jgi:hypothetical protein